MAGEGEPRAASGAAALVLAVAALASAWNPLSAPLALVVGGGAAVLAARALRRGARRALAGTALVTALAAAASSALVLALTAGAVGIELPGEPVVRARTQAELDQVLTEAAERTRAERERARSELEQLGPAGGGGPPRTPGRNGAGQPSQPKAPGPGR